MSSSRDFFQGSNYQAGQTVIASGRDFQGAFSRDRGSVNRASTWAISNSSNATNGIGAFSDLPSRKVALINATPGASDGTYHATSPWQVGYPLPILPGSYNIGLSIGFGLLFNPFGHLSIHLISVDGTQDFDLTPAAIGTPDNTPPGPHWGGSFLGTVNSNTLFGRPTLFYARFGFQNMPGALITCEFEGHH